MADKIPNLVRAPEFFRNNIPPAKYPISVTPVAEITESIPNAS